MDADGARGSAVLLLMVAISFLLLRWAKKQGWW